MATLPAALAKRIGPVDASPIMSAGAAGTLVHPRVDEVLLYLTNYGDEREYETMFRLDTAISGAAQQRIAGVVEAGSEVLLGRSGRASAGRLRDFSISFLKRIPALGVIQAEMVKAIFWGWRPIELQWGEIRHKGRPYQGVVRAVARMPWNYEVTVDGGVVRLGYGRDGGVQPRERFLVCTAGGTASPYGEAWLRRLWALYHLSSSFDKMSARAFSRALGLMKATPPANMSISDASAQLGSIVNNINSYNTLIEPSNWKFDWLDFAGLPESLEGLLRFLDERKRIAIVGQNLSTEVRGGSFAAASAHIEGILGTYLRADARTLGQWMNDGLILTALRMNFGEIDPDDAPRWQSRLFSKPDHEAVKLFFDLGGALDGKRLAETLGVPAAIDDAGGEVVLRKQAPATIPAAAPGQPEPPPTERSRSLTMGSDADLSAVPMELVKLNRWVVWRYELRGDRLAKIHYSPHDPLTEASPSDPETWGNLLHARTMAIKHGGFEGVAFTFTADDPYCGVDLDDCLGDAGGISTVAGGIVARLNTYTEISPSGRGVKLWCRAKLPAGRRRKIGVEMYDANRFFAVTGRHLTGTPLTIEDRQAEIEVIHAEMFG